jgi:type III secretion system YscD/HrpQ family protein
MKPLLELRVLAGPALGGCIELTAGSHVVGSGDACDIVLTADTTVAKRHLVLEIREPAGADAGEVEVLARPAGEASVIINGLAIPAEGTRLPKGEILGLGFTALAWRLPGEAWGPITLVPLEFAQLTQKQTPASVQDTAPEPEKTARTQPERPPPEPAAQQTAPPPPRTPRRTWKWGGIALIALLLVAAMATTVLGRDNSGATVQKLKDELQRTGFETVSVALEADRRALVLSGTVPNDKDLNRLLQIAGQQPLRVHMNVRVGDDQLRSLRETLNAHGFFPEVTYLDARNTQLHLALYLQDAYAENRMLALGRDIPGLRAASRKVIYAQDVAPVLEDALHEWALNSGKVDYLPGKVRLFLPVTPGAKEKLAAALNRVRQNLGIRIEFEVISETSAEPLTGDDASRAAAPDKPTPAPADTASALAPETDMLGKLKVMSVTPGVMPFVTLSDQQKLFPGAVLPNGAILIGIYTDRLILKKDQETLTYRFKETP